MPKLTMQPLKLLLDQLTQIRILCIGDLMLDRFIYGTVDRVSPEAPVPVFQILREVETLGGAGNVVRNLQSLGAHVYFCSVVGNDSPGQKVISSLKSLENVESFLLQDSHRSTTLKTRFVAGDQQLLRADQENVLPLGADHQKHLLEWYRKILPQVQVVILSDYGKGLLVPEMVHQLIRGGQSAGIPVVVDPKGTNYQIYRGATVLTPNLKELKEAVRIKNINKETICHAALTLISDCEFEAVLTTQGPQGMILVDKTHGRVEIPAHTLDVFDVSGAGDTVIATLALVLGAGGTLVEAARLANVAAGVVVAKIGTATVSKTELEEHILDLFSGSSPSENKILTWDQAHDRVLYWHKQGLRIGFTNGCFDLLHPGHLASFRQARDHCDRLVVGLNSDSSIRALKGPMRPIQDQKARSQILAALESVDVVCLFDERTPLKLIQYLRPDVLIKGADYQGKEISGAKEVQEWGGKIILIPLEPYQSTTQTIAKISRKQQAQPEKRA